MIDKLNDFAAWLGAHLVYAGSKAAAFAHDPLLIFFTICGAGSLFIITRGPSSEHR